MAKAGKGGSGSMAADQTGRKGEFAGGEVVKGDGMSKGGQTGVGGSPSMSQFNERSKADFPGGKVDTGDGYSK